MSDRSTLKGGLGLGLNEATSQAGSFVRSVIIARLISPQDFGIATTFALMFSLLQMISNLASEMLIVQADNGDEPAFQCTAHLLQAWRGIAIGCVLLITGGYVARLFGVPTAKVAFECLAIVPVVKGFAHTDIFRFQRASRFGPFMTVNIWTTLITTSVSLPLALWLRTYTVMVWVLLIQALCMTVISHLVASRPYRWAWNPLQVKQMVSFGWPLLINGLLMYLIFQGDRLVIGAAERLFSRASYSLADLAVYSVAFSVVQMPTMLIANVCTALFLPLLSRVRDEKPHFDQNYLSCSLIVCLTAAATAAPLILAGPWLIELSYGHEYRSAGSLVIWLAAMQAVRIIRITPTLGATALGDTKNAMVSNIVRTPAFVFVLLAAAVGRPLVWIAAAGLAGELLAFAYSVWRLLRRHSISPQLCLGPCAVVGVGLGVAAATQSTGFTGVGLTTALMVSGVVVGVVFSVMVFAYPRLRSDLHSFLVW